MNRNNSSKQFSQPHLFNPGKEQDAERYYHFDSTAEFGARDPWRPAASPMHFGTAQAAMDRGHQVRDTYGSGFGDPVQGAIHVGRLKPRRPLMNTRDMPMSDDMANVLSDRSADADYWVAAGQEVAMAKGISQEEAEDEIENEGFRFRHDERGGYYRNAMEDKGSISMVLNRPDRDLQHLGTVGYEPEYRNEVRGMAADPITGKQRSASFTEIRRGVSGTHGIEPNEVLGPQFSWSQDTLI